MNKRLANLPPLLAGMLLVCVVVLSIDDVSAHGGGNWNAFRIDGVNDDARGRVLELQQTISEVIRGRAGRDEWPLGGFRTTRDSLITVKEEVDEILEHYVIDGTDILVAANLRAEPRAGRTVAASRALDASIALIEHAASLDSAAEFVSDFYANGMSMRLYELLEAHVDRMELYATLTVDED